MLQTIYIFMNKSLGMSTGKIASQSAHAAVAAMMISTKSRIAEYESANERAVIVLQARDENHISNIAEYLSKWSIRTAKIIDEGITEVDPQSVTALAVEIVDKKSDDVINAFKSFKTYRDTIRFTMELDR